MRRGYGCDDAGEGGLPRPRRTPEDQRGDAVRGDGPPEKAPLPHHLILAGDLGQIVDTQIRARSSLLAEFQQLSRSDVSVGGRTGQAVTYAYVTARSGRPPVVYEARDLYIPTDSGVLVISLQSPMETFDDAVPAFEQFAEGFDTADLTAARSLLSALA